MHDSEYIPLGSESMMEWRRAQKRSDSELDAQRVKERDEAMNLFLDHLTELEEQDIPKVQFEIVRPLGKLAAMARSLSHSKDERVIRADTIQGSRIVRHTQRRAQITPRKGYMLPSIGAANTDLGTALFPDGTSGTIMKWDRYSKGSAVYVNWTPPHEAYWCDGYGDVKFFPKYYDDRFEPRNCRPVWGNSIVPPSAHVSSHTLEALSSRVRELIILSEAERIINNFEP